MATLNTLNGRTVRLFVTPGRMATGLGLELAAKEQLGLKNVVAGYDRIIGRLGNGMRVELLPTGKNHAKVFGHSWLDRPYRMNATYKVRTFR